MGAFSVWQEPKTAKKKIYFYDQHATTNLTKQCKLIKTKK